MSDRRQRKADFWHRPNRPMCLGCFGCPHLATCGGLTIDQSVTDCFDFCECAPGVQCPFVCPSNARNFVARYREVRGFDLENVAQGAEAEWPNLPLMIPLIPNGYSRSRVLNGDAVALSTNTLFGAKSGKPIHATREDIARHFSFSPQAKIVLSGVGYDRHLENYWAAARAACFPEYLQSINVDMVTTPNFSLFNDVPRTDDQYNMKRIALCWQELAALKIPTAIHVNARTNHDWRRWSQFLKSHPEALGLAFEFRTGAASPHRAPWYRDRLLELAQSVGRRLFLVLRGGTAYLRELGPSFSVVFLSHSPIIRALRRRKLIWKPGMAETWHRCPVENGDGLDDLVKHNLAAFAKMIEHIQKFDVTRN